MIHRGLSPLHLTRAGAMRSDWLMTSESRYTRAILKHESNGRYRGLTRNRRGFPTASRENAHSENWQSVELRRKTGSLSLPLSLLHYSAPSPGTRLRSFLSRPTTVHLLSFVSPQTARLIRRQVDAAFEIYIHVQGGPTIRASEGLPSRRRLAAFPRGSSRTVSRD